MLTISQILSPDTISQLNNLFLKAKFVVEGFIVGLHKSPYHGFSIEFSEHRAYGQGDEIKHIDWKLWGKTDKYFVKQFEEETNLKSYLLFDQSASMKYKSDKISKLDYSKLIAASTYLFGPNINGPIFFSNTGSVIIVVSPSFIKKVA